MMRPEFKKAGLRANSPGASLAPSTPATGDGDPQRALEVAQAKADGWNEGRSELLPMLDTERRRTEAAERALADLRGRVEALADEWEGWAKTRSTTRIDAFRDAAESLRAALLASEPQP